MTEDDKVMAVSYYKTNADLILAAHKLGYVTDEHRVLDTTLGRGVWWKKYRPANMVTNDLGKGHPDMRFDFRHAPFEDNTFDVVAYDPPYKLNGTPDADVDERYGVEVPTRWQERMALMLDGLEECCRISRKFVLAKCQDQVCSGDIRWQTFEMRDRAVASGMVLEDMLTMAGKYRKQPEGRRQVHAQRNCSTLMVFKRL